MEFLGVSINDGIVYEGGHSMGFRSHPAPYLTPITFAIDQEAPKQKIRNLAYRLFREDTFDPVSRIRRGRVFYHRDTSQPHRWAVQDPFRQDLRDKGTFQQAEVIMYDRDGLGHLIGKDGIHYATLGETPFTSIWRIVDIEQSAHGTPMLTLKSHRTLGDVPNLNTSTVPETIRAKLEDSLQRVADANHRLGVVAVIDRCRDALSVVFGHLVDDATLDLGPALNKLEASRHCSALAGWAGRAVARLHSRAKPNEREKHMGREITEDDAPFALACVGLILRELGWADTARQQPGLAPAHSLH